MYYVGHFYLIIWNGDTEIKSTFFKIFYTESSCHCFTPSRDKRGQSLTYSSCSIVGSLASSASVAFGRLRRQQGNQQDEGDQHFGLNAINGAYKCVFCFKSIKTWGWYLIQYLSRSFICGLVSLSLSGPVEECMQLSLPSCTWRRRRGEHARNKSVCVHSKRMRQDRRQSLPQARFDTALI